MPHAKPRKATGCRSTAFTQPSLPAAANKPAAPSAWRNAVAPLLGRLLGAGLYAITQARFPPPLGTRERALPSESVTLLEAVRHCAPGTGTMARRPQPARPHLRVWLGPFRRPACEPSDAPAFHCSSRRSTPWRGLLLGGPGRSQKCAPLPKDLPGRACRRRSRERPRKTVLWA